jgi:hypothetical protein
MTVTGYNQRLKELQNVEQGSYKDQIKKYGDEDACRDSEATQKVIQLLNKDPTILNRFPNLTKLCTHYKNGFCRLATICEFAHSYPLISAAELVKKDQSARGKVRIKVPLTPSQRAKIQNQSSDQPAAAAPLSNPVGIYGLEALRSFAKGNPLPEHMTIDLRGLDTYEISDVHLRNYSDPVLDVDLDGLDIEEPISQPQKPTEPVVAAVRAPSKKGPPAANNSASTNRFALLETDSDSEIE